MTGLREAFAGVRRALEGAGVRYALGGSWASTAYGEPRQTNDIDMVAAFHRSSLGRFLDLLGGDFYYDRDNAFDSLRLLRPFNVIHRRLAIKFDLFPITGEYGQTELERSQGVEVPVLDHSPVPVVSAEDIVLAKLAWFRDGGEISRQQWRDIVGVLRAETERIDYGYLEAWSRRLGLAGLLERALRDAAEI